MYTTERNRRKNAEREDSSEVMATLSHWADGRSKAHVAAGAVTKGGKPAEQSRVSTFLSRKTWSKSEDTC